MQLQKYDGSSWSKVVDLLPNYGHPTSYWSKTFDGLAEIDDTIQGIRILFKIDSASASNRITRLYTLEYGTTYGSSSTVETNTIIDEVVPKSIVVYGKTDIPTGTSITVDVSDDGGSTFSITGKSLNTYIDTSSFSGSDLALKFNLATTDTSITPKLYGYGVAITDE